MYGAALTTVLLFWHLPLQHAWCCIDNCPVVLTSTPSTCMVLYWQSSCCSDIYPFNMHGAVLTIVLLFWHLPFNMHGAVLTIVLLFWHLPFNMHGAALTIVLLSCCLPLQHVWCCIDCSWSLPWCLPLQVHSAAWTSILLPCLPFQHARCWIDHRPDSYSLWHAWPNVISI